MSELDDPGPTTLCDICACERDESETITCDCGAQVCDVCRPQHECDDETEETK